MPETAKKKGGGEFVAETAKKKPPIFDDINIIKRDIKIGSVIDREGIRSKK